jgi:hypothetical protein
MPTVRIAIVRYTSLLSSSLKAASDQVNGSTLPVKASLAQKAFSSRMKSAPK